MSDFIIGTIIGGSIGVIGSIVGFVIQGHYSKKNTELQVDARRNEQLINFEHQKEETRTSRSIELMRSSPAPKISI